MNGRWDVLGIGCSAVDDLVLLEGFPQPDMKMQVQEFHRQGGGLTATALVAVARMGLKAAYCGRLGENDLSQYTIQELEREGVDCSPVHFVPGARPFHAIVLVDQVGGSRTILYSPEGVGAPDPSVITPELVASCKVLFVDHFASQAGLRAIRLAHARGIPVVADIESDSFPEREALMELVDHLIIGIGLARRLTGEDRVEDAVSDLARSERACSIVTAGEKGCWYAERDGKVRHFPAFHVQVVDTTGCGDVFHGAYAACIARGESVDRAIQVATAAAGLKATRPGGRAGIPDLPTIERFLKRVDSII